MNPLTDLAPGLKLHVVAGTGTFADSAGTMASVNAGPVALWKDQSPAANHLFVGPELNNRFAPGTCVDTGGVKAVRFGAYQGLRTILSPATQDPVSVHWYGRFTLPENSHMLVGFDDYGAANSLITDNAGVNTWGTQTLGNSFNATDGTDHLVSVVQSGGVATIYLDGVPYATANISIPQINAIWVGSIPWNTAATYGQATEVLVAYAAHTPAQVTAYFEYLQQTYSARYSGPAVVFIGNSLGTTTFCGFPSICQAACSGITAGVVNRWINASVGGITTSQINASVNTIYGPIIAAESLVGQQTVGVIMEGTNDLLAGSTPAQAYANLITCAQLLRLAGATKIVVATAIARNGLGSPANFDAVRLPLNAMIRADQTNFDAVADVGADTIIGQASSLTNSTYFIGDQAHLTAAGTAIAATYFTTAIQAAIQATTAGVLAARASLLALASEIATMKSSVDSQITGMQATLAAALAEL